MKKLIIFCVVAVLAVGIFSLTYRYASQDDLAWHSSRLTAKGSDLVKLEGEGVEPSRPREDRQEANVVYRDWSMYANDDYGFTIRYPQNLKVKAEGVDLLRGEETKSLAQFFVPGQKDSRGTSIMISTRPVVDDGTLNTMAAAWSQEKGTVLSETEITVDGVRAVRYWLSTPLEEGETLREDGVLLRKGDDILIFTSVGLENRELFEQMLDTVNFHF